MKTMQLILTIVWGLAFASQQLHSQDEPSPNEAPIEEEQPSEPTNMEPMEGMKKKPMEGMGMKKMDGMGGMKMPAIDFGLNSLLRSLYHVHGESEAHGHGHEEESDDEHGHASFEEGIDIQEVRVGISTVVDNLLRATVHLSFTDEWDFYELYAENIERLWWMQLKVGKFFPVVGADNHVPSQLLPFANKSLHQQNLLGGEAGISQFGVGLNILFPIPVVPLELGTSILQGDDRDLIDLEFGSSKGFNMRFTHLKALLEFDSQTLLEARVSYAGDYVFYAAGTGNERSETVVNLNVFDLTFMRMDASGKAPMLTLSTEWAWREIHSYTGDAEHSLAGGHLFAQYKVAGPLHVQYRYSMGGLLSDHDDDFMQMHSVGFALASARAMFRLQYDLEQHDGDLSGDLVGQLSFSLGSQKAHSYHSILAR